MNEPDTPYKLSSYHRDYYGRWAGSERGVRAKPDQCATSVYPGNSFISRQCCRKRGHGPESAFCKQHAKLDVSK
jgi:hypothetical protein